MVKQSVEVLKAWWKDVESVMTCDLCVCVCLLHICAYICDYVILYRENRKESSACMSQSHMYKSYSLDYADSPHTITSSIYSIYCI